MEIRRRERKRGKKKGEIEAGSKRKYEIIRDYTG